MKYLPVHENPPIKSYLHHAYPIGVILANNSDALPWIRSFFLQLYFDSSNISYKMDFYPPSIYRYECLDDGHIKSSIIRENLINITKELIEDNYYLTFVADEFYIPNTYSFKKQHFNHWLLINGYDEECFFCVGYLSDRKYKKFSISYKIFVNAVIKDFGIGVYRINENYKFEYDYLLAKELIYDYIYSKNTSLKNRIYRLPNNAIYGRSVYNAMIDDLEKVFDYRYAHILIEHKENIIFGLKCFGCSDEVIDNYKKVIKKCRYLEYIYLKQSLKYSVDLKLQAVDLIKRIDEEEICVLSKAYNNYVGNFKINDKR